MTPYHTTNNITYDLHLIIYLCFVKRYEFTSQRIFGKIVNSLSLFLDIRIGTRANRTVSMKQSMFQMTIKSAVLLSSRGTMHTIYSKDQLLQQDQERKGLKNSNIS